MEIKTVVQKNPSLLSSRQKVKALLGDYFFDEKIKINVMLNAYDLGIIRALGDYDKFTKGIFITELTSKYGVRDDLAAWAVETWVSILPKSIIGEVLELEKGEKLTEEARLRELLNKPEDPIEEIQEISDIKDEYERCYINPMRERDSRIYIPCGFGNTDKGFFICGIKKTYQCNHENGSIFALIYNYFIRNSKMTEVDIPETLLKKETTYRLDYRSIYRLAIIVLQLIKNNYIQGYEVPVICSGDESSLAYAIEIINFYYALFSRLAGITNRELKLCRTDKVFSVSLKNKTGIYVEENNELQTNAREIWYGQKINYHLDINDTNTTNDLRFLLKEISPFEDFKEGQLNALISMLNTKTHAVCIMPTGSGKSLIYYFAAILQPAPIFVISPTDILIRDQIRNLRKFHRIDNVAHLQLTEENSFYNYCIQCNINFLTPTTFQNSKLIASFRHINKGTEFISVGTGKDGRIMSDVRVSSGPLVSYIVLDEIHCLSNWGHDFRPEYLMLSRYLNKYLDQIPFLGFTATANYTVVGDIQKQLGIEEKNFFSPISFDKYNVTYDFRSAKSSDEMYAILSSVIKSFIAHGQRTLIFTKTNEIAQKVAQVVGYEADVFSSENPESYYQFVEGKCLVLVADEDLGVGVNLPDIRNIIHFGFPLSKNEYVQEIGRAGRADEAVTSVIIYLDSAAIPEELMRRDTAIASYPMLLKGLNNDYFDVFVKLTNGSIQKEDLFKKLINLYHELDNGKHALYCNPYDLKDANQVKQLLFMLYVTGYVKDWYAYSLSKDGSQINILIDLYSTGKINGVPFSRMQNKLVDYFDSLGNNREGVVKANRATTREEIFHIYVDWYYDKYLYHHKEEFLDFYDFILRNTKCDAIEIAEEIKDYFVLPFIQIKADESKYAGMSIAIIGQKAIQGIDRATIANIERINTDKYSYKLDFLLFCTRYRMDGQFEESRLTRILDYVCGSDLKELTDVLISLFPYGEVRGRLQVVNYIENNETALGVNVRDFLDEEYKHIDKDNIYYGVLAKAMNKKIMNVLEAQYV